MVTVDVNVVELEKVNKFDGADIIAFMRSVLYQSKSPGKIKKYSHARLVAELNGALVLSGRIEYDFDQPDWNLGDDLNFDTDEAGGYWDDLRWDNFIWDKRTSGSPQVKIEGEGPNASVYLFSTSQVCKPSTLLGMSQQWLPRRSDRRTKA